MIENKEKFQFIHKYLYHSSSDSDKLTQNQHNKLFSLGDGYGKMTEEELRRKGLMWDWSHIRDSSELALEKIYTELKIMVDALE